MIESAATRIVESPIVKRALSLVNRVPVPYHRLPVTVRGHRMAARTLDRFLALWFWKFGVFGKAEHDLLGRLCREGMAVLDIGANVGFHTLLFARAVGPNGRVWAFEPDPDNFATLAGNIERNGYRNVTAVSAAVGAETGEVPLYRSSFHCDHRIYPTGDGPGGIPVKMIAIDDFIPPGQRIDLVKMDIQGAEGLALRGMRRVISSNPGMAMVMEFWPEGLRKTGFDPERVLSELAGAGFALHRIREEDGSLEALRDTASFVGTLRGSMYANVLAVRE